MSLTVLSDEQISDLLHNVNEAELDGLRTVLAEALHEYSTGTPEIATCCQNQPVRQMIASQGGKTLFMPSQTTASIGIKVVSLHASEAKNTDSDRISSATNSLSHVSFADSTSNLSTTSRASTHSSTQSSSPQRHTHHQPSTQATHFSHHYSAKSSLHQANSLDEDDEPEINPPPKTHPTGTLTLLTPQGKPHAFLSATTLTAFRTAVASSLLFSKRTRVHTVVIFGAGAQAYWHLRVALLLRGKEIHHVRIINRTFATAGPLLRTIYTSPLWTALRSSNPKLDFTLLTPEYGEYQRLLKEYIRSADVIFCTVPSTEPLFPASFLTSSEGRRKGRYLSLIGSYQSSMCEVSPEILRAAVEGGSTKSVRAGGAVVVDSLEACLKDAGEIVRAHLEAHQLVELGELIMMKRAARREIEMGSGGDGQDLNSASASDSDAAGGMVAWLKEGNVVYKSVGVGVMDLSVGMEIVRLAREKGVGITIDNF